jgi:hypothetical protein
VLHEHGYPRLESGLDLVHLQQHVFAFLHGVPLFDAEDDTPEEDADSRTPSLTVIRSDDAMIDALMGGHPPDGDVAGAILQAWLDDLDLGGGR